MKAYIVNKQLTGSTSTERMMITFDESAARDYFTNLTHELAMNGAAIMKVHSDMVTFNQLTIWVSVAEVTELL